MARSVETSFPPTIVEGWRKTMKPITTSSRYVPMKCQKGDSSGSPPPRASSGSAATAALEFGFFLSRQFTCRRAYLFLQTLVDAIGIERFGRDGFPVARTGLTLAEEAAPI